MQRKILGLAFLSLAIGCGDDDGADGADDGAGPDGSPGADASDEEDAGTIGDATPPGGDAGPGEYPVHIIRPSCAPNDAPSVQIVLGDASDQECAVDDAAPRVQLDVWTQEITAPAVFSWSETESTAAGALCPGGTTPCRSFPSGDISFTTYAEGRDATGSWRLIGEDDSMVTGEFEAIWCDPDPPRPCG